MPAMKMNAAQSLRAIGKRSARTRGTLSGEVLRAASLVLMRRDYMSFAKLNCAMRRLRISAISFLNTAPLMWDFHHPEDAGENLNSEFEVAYTLPSLCAEALQT